MKKTLLTVIMALGMSITGFAQSWDFEDGTGDWYVTPGTLELSGDVAFSGTSSVKITSEASNNQTEIGLEAYKNAVFTDTLKFQLYVDATNLTNINGVQVFYKQGAGWTWNATWIGAGELVADTWNELAFVVAEDLGTVQSMGLLVDETAAENVTTFYVDGVEVAPFVEPLVEEDREVVTFDFDSGIDAWSVAGGTAETSSDFFLSGITSVKLTSAGDSDATDFTTTSHLDIEPGDTLSFLVWAEDLSTVNGFQLFAKNGDAFDWSATFTGSGDLFAGQWNKVNHVVPIGFDDIREWGIQLATLTSTDTPTIYLENASIAPYIYKEVEPVDPIFVDFDFEDSSLSNWTIGNNHGNAAVTTQFSYSGLHAVELSTAVDDSVIEFVNYSPPAYAPNQTIRLNVFVPADTSNLKAINPYVQYDEWSGWASNWNSVGDLIPGVWNSISIDIPEYSTLNAVGLQVLGQSKTGFPPIYVDLISSDPETEPVVTLLPPTNLTADSVSRHYVALSWDDAVGNNLSSYSLYRTSTQEMLTLVKSGLTTSSYLDTTVQSSTEYTYYVSAVDSFARETESSDGFWVKTNSYEINYTWDFELHADQWQDYVTLDSATLVDTISYSGQFSMLVQAHDGEPFGAVISPAEPEASQRFVFNFFIPSDASNIAGFTVSSDLENDTNFVYKDFSEFETGTWNQFTYDIPDYDLTSWIAFSVISESSGSTPIFVDLITSGPNEMGVPTVTAPDGITVMEITKNSTSLEWNPSEGYGDILYNVYRTQIIENKNTSPQLVATLSEHTFVDYNLLAGATYVYFVTGVDFVGRETEVSNSVSVSTKDFPSHATFDFEYGTMEGWTTTQGTAELTDEKSYSGVYSVKFTTGATESFFEFIDDTTDAPGTPTLGDIRLGHTITYRVWVSADDTAKISLFQIWAKDGTWGWASNVVYPSDLTPNAWTEMSFTIPEDYSNINSVGFQIIGKVLNENPEISVFIDLISTEATPYIRPHLTVPGSLSASDAFLSTTLTWGASIGTETVDKYVVFARNIDLEEEFIEVSSTTETSATVDIEIEGNYEFQVIAVTPAGLKTLPASIEKYIMGGLSVENNDGLPKEFKLFNNYPNPFNPSTVISYQLPANSHVKLSVYNLTGQLVQTLVDEVKNTGSYEVNFNASSLASGMYMYRLEAGSFVQVQRMMLIK